VDDIAFVGIDLAELPKTEECYGLAVIDVA
jgi:hypothetical protein